MTGELPPHVVASIAFIGRSGGQIKTLGGFKKGQHTIPDAANAATNAFLGKICAAELSEEAETLFQQVRTGLGYKRKEITLSLTSPAATLTAKDFTVEIGYEVDDGSPALFRTTTTLRDLHDVALSRTEAFVQIFGGRFSEIEFAFAKAASVEAVIDAIEALEGETTLTVDYPSDYDDCTIRVEGVPAEVRCTGAALQVVFPRGGSPAELIDAFALVRDAFQISKVLRGLIAA